jgi:DNA-binding LytR/AlgR family response regulator
MNILIVENEAPAAERLKRLLKNIDKSLNISGLAETVEETINIIESGAKIDLILMDIQLDDGLCFEIFETINVDTPVIFTTAFDEYMLKAFKVNSLDYLLKPIDEESLEKALSKYRKLYEGKSDYIIDLKKLLTQVRDQYKMRFLIKIGDKYKSLQVSEINYFHIFEKSVFIRDYNGKDYALDYSLEQLVSFLDPSKFFRINRECIVNIDSVTLMYSYSSSRLQLTLKNEPKNELFVVSRDRVAAFKNWTDR